MKYVLVLTALWIPAAIAECILPDWRPPYSPLARNSGVTGTFQANVTFDATASVSAIQTSGHMLLKAVVPAALKSLVIPLDCAGATLAITIHYTIDTNLKPGSERVVKRCGSSCWEVRTRPASLMID